MKVHYIGVARRYGTSSKTGKQYDMCMLSYAVPIKGNVTQSMNYSGFGYEVKEVDLDPNAMNNFALCKLGEIVDVEVQPNPIDLTRNIVSGIVGKSSVGVQAKEEKF
jgi:hypothetical protein